MEYQKVIDILKSHANPANAAGMARYGITTSSALGVSMPILRKLGHTIGRDHDLAGRLWESGIHEARILAGLVAEPEKMTDRQMEQWIKDVDSWDVCDQLCSNLLDRCEGSWDKSIEWTSRKEEFTRRAGFVLMACFAVHDKKATESQFLPLLKLIEQGANDERNFVKKAVNWALRQIGKRNSRLNSEAVKVAQRLKESSSRAARWVGADAYRELTSEKTGTILAKKEMAAIKGAEKASKRKAKK